MLSGIIAITDSYDTMTSDRPYREGLASSVALEEIRSHSGTQFDPELVEQFIQPMQEWQDGPGCSRLQSCEIFIKIAENDLSRAYKTQYWYTNFKAWAR